MRYDYPFAYRIDYLINGGQKPANRYLMDHVPVDIPEITLDDAPIVATWSIIDEVQREIPTLLRYFNGSFLAPTASRKARLDKGLAAVDLPVRGSSKREAIDDILGLFNHWDLGRYYGPTREYLLEGKEQSRPKPDKVSAALGGSYAEMRAEAEYNANSLVIVDGEVYNKVFEPVLHMSIGGGNLQGEVYLKAPYYDRMRRNEHFSIGSPKKSLLYRFDQQEEFDDEFRRRAAAGAGRPRPLVLFNDIQVINPDVFAFSPAENTAVRTLGHLVHEYGYQPLHRWERSALTEFLDLRDRYEAYISEESQEDIEGLLADAARIVGSQLNMLGQSYVDFLHNMETVRNNPPEIRLPQTARQGLRL